MISYTPWLPPQEHREVVERLVQYKLVTYDPAGRLPLKSGGTTDVYINLRDARNDPDAIIYITSLFKRALSILDLSRFIEIPTAVSCFAGPLSIALKKPYVTIRDTPKVGRVSDSAMIGSPFMRNEPVAIIDDVITDGASKVDPIRESQRRGAYIVRQVVLVDREAGWQDTFAREGITVPVWAGMTLSDVRRELIAIG